MRNLLRGLVAHEAEDVLEVCEVGFNFGHSSLLWLLEPRVRVRSFDLGERSRPDARAYQAYDALVAKHASPRGFEASARARLSALLCGDENARDDDVRAALAPALDLLQVDMCAPPD